LGSHGICPERRNPTRNAVEDCPRQRALVPQGKGSPQQPEGAPTDDSLSVWSAKVATALTEASIYHDKADVPWLMRACDPDTSFDYPVEQRLQGLGTMLATNLQAQIKTGELGRALAKKTVSALERNRLITGRHSVNMIADHLRLSDSMSMVYSSTGITAIKWRGDTPEQGSQFKANLENALDNMDPTGYRG
jgi:hypothetical protein